MTTTVVVSRKLVTLDRRAATGVMRIHPATNPRTPVLTPGGGLLDPSPVPLTLSSTGAYSIVLPRSSQCTPAGVEFIVDGVTGFSFRFRSDDEDTTYSKALGSTAIRTLGGTVVGLDGKPISGLVVACGVAYQPGDQPFQLMDGSLLVPTELHTTTDLSGAYSFTVLSRASYVGIAPRLLITAAWNVSFSTDTPV